MSVDKGTTDFENPGIKAALVDSVEKITTENHQLRFELERISTELANQKRELDIEAALEVVRSIAMSMQHSEEFEQVVASLFDRLVELGLSFDGALILLLDKVKRDILVWVATVQLPAPVRIDLPFDAEIENNQIIQDFWSATQKGGQFISKTYSDQEKNDYFRYVQKYNALKIPDSVKKLQIGIDSWTFSYAAEKNSIIGFDSWSGHIPREEDSRILVRFAKVFEQTYVRFLDLQKAEAQAREAQIEAALEKVRSTSLAMHKGEELKNVMMVVFEKLKELGLTFDGAGIQLYAEGSKDITQWVAAPDLLAAPILANLPFVEKDLNESAILRDYWNAKETGKSFCNTNYSFDEKNKFFEFAGSHNDFTAMPGEVRKFQLQAPDYTQTLIAEKRSALWVDSYSGQTISKEGFGVLTKFARVFEQAYVRFLDIEKAEEQAREAQIEAALERVRSRTMAMHRSAELQEAALLLFKQVQILGISVFTCGYNIWEIGENVCTGWMSSEGMVQPPFKIPLTESPTFIHFRESREKGIPFYVEEVGGYALAEHYTYMLSIPEFVEVAEKFANAGFKFPTFQVNHVVNFKHGNLIFISTEALPKAHEIFKRFAKVFEQTYTRFLDLQKAEAQAKEAQIETTLERVRARTMGMQKSEDLRQVVKVLYAQLKELGFEHGVAAINIMDQNSGDLDSWSEGFEDGYDLPEKYLVPYFEHPGQNELFMHWKSGASYAVVEIAGEQKKSYDNYYFFHTDFAKVPESTKQLMMQKEAILFSMAYMQYGALTWAPSSLSEEQAKILQRFSKVFEQSYTRFLDLQKAESQAREAQIETALERVRAKTMGMQKSEDLRQVVKVLYAQLKVLGFKHGVAAITIMDSDAGDIDWWMEGFEDGYDLPEKYHVPNFDNKGHHQQLAHWKNGSSYAVIKISGLEKKAYDSYYFFQTDFAKAPDNSKNLMMSQEAVIFSMAYMKYGALSWSPSKLDENQAIVLQRMAKVFEQTYTRFLDLQKAEAQAREAQIEVALERIRARALAMQSSTELTEMVKVLRDQMGILGQEDLEASVVHLYSPGSPIFDSWYAFRGGDNIIEGQATFRLENSALAKEFLELYLDDITEYTIEAKGEKLKEWLAEIKKNAPRIAAYWGNLPPEKQYYHFSDFSGGALLMVSHQNLSQETRMLQKRCAWVFELAYKRFLDLLAKERQDKELREEKQRLELTLTELKATQSQLIQQEKLASLGQLTAGIAHEIQNPLNFVNNFSEVSAELMVELKGERLKVKGERDEAVEIEIIDDVILNLEKISHHGKRADAIVKGMLHHSRTSSGEKVPTDINDLADEYLRLSFHGMRAKDKNFKADFVTDFDLSLPKVNVVPQEIGRVLLNIINNAFYACSQPSKGSEPLESFKPLVTISTKKLGDKIEITISDNGPGIPDSIKDKIFQPFFTTKPTGEGTGLGLSLSYDIVKAHGGEIVVESSKNQGTLFSIHLPH